MTAKNNKLVVFTSLEMGSVVFFTF